MPPPQIGLKFSEKPGQDLATRTDFTFDLMHRVAKAGEEILREGGLVREFEDRARMEIRISPTLRASIVDVIIIPLPGVDLSESQRQEIRAKARELLAESLPVRFSEIFGGALRGARERIR